MRGTELAGLPTNADGQHYFGQLVQTKHGRPANGGLKVKHLVTCSVEDSIGTRFKAMEPDWPHECCWPGACAYRARLDGGIMRCEAVSLCNYHVPQNTTREGRRSRTIDGVVGNSESKGGRHGPE